MAQTNATLSLFGESVAVRITRMDGGIVIRDAQGKTFDLPQGVGVDFSSGKLYYNNEVVGGIDPFNFVSLPLEGLEELTSTAGSAGNGGGFPNIDPATGLPIDSGAAAGGAGGPLVDGLSTTGGGFVMGTLKDGGARDLLAGGKPLVKPIHSFTPTPAIDTDDGPASPVKAPTPAATAPAPRTQTTGGGPATPPPQTGVLGPAWQSGLGAAAAGLSALQWLGSRFNWFNNTGGLSQADYNALATYGGGAPSSGWANLNTLGKTVAVAGVAISSVSLFIGMFSLARQFSWEGVMNSGMSAVSLYFALGAMGPSGWVALGIIAAIAAAGYIIGLLTEDKREGNKENTEEGDGGAMPNAGPWYEAMPQDNVYMILTGAAFAIIGIHLSVGSPPVQEVPVTIAELPGVRNLIASDVDKPLPTYAEGVMGKVFIQSAGNNGITPDKVVYVSKEGDKSYRVRMASLNYRGKVLGDLPPGMGRPALFGVSNGAIVATPEGNAAVAHLLAMSRAANGATDPASAAAATIQGGAAGTGAEFIPHIENPPGGY